MTENLINPTSSSAKSGSIFSFQLIFIGFKTKDCLKPLKEAFNRHLDKIEVNDFTVFVSAVFSLLPSPWKNSTPVEFWWAPLEQST